MADWESFRKILEDQYLTKNHTLAAVKEYMTKEYNFNASKAQYEAKFGTWEWRKNLSESEWKYVASKFEERGDRDTEVYLHGRRILPKKVKKEISRHVRPTLSVARLGSKKCRDN